MLMRDPTGFGNEAFFNGLHLFSKQATSKSLPTNQSSQTRATLSELTPTAQKRQSKK